MTTPLSNNRWRHASRMTVDGCQFIYNLFFCFFFSIFKFIPDLSIFWKEWRWTVSMCLIEPEYLVIDSRRGINWFCFVSDSDQIDHQPRPKTLVNLIIFSRLLRFPLKNESLCKFFKTKKKKKILKNYFQLKFSIQNQLPRISQDEINHQRSSKNFVF